MISPSLPLFSSVSSVVMERRVCPPGSQWDSLLKHCIPHKSLGVTPSAVPPPVLSTRGPDESWSTISPSVWICVGLVVSGSVLVLLLWFIIYRRHSGTSQLTGQKDSTPHTPTSIEQEEEALSPWPQVNGQAQEVPINEGPCGRSLCNGWAEHGLPLPATELGDSALVTAKTGQPV
uniref:Tumor necrosis factor receptor superfamily member 13C-like n=1 Tax=Cyprinus carpio TaxID=7962 RepID=A0A8C2ERB7_CYPCA